MIAVLKSFAVAVVCCMMVLGYAMVMVMWPVVGLVGTGVLALTMGIWSSGVFDK